MAYLPKPARALPLLLLASLVSGCGALRFQSPITANTGELRVGPDQMTVSAIQSEVMSFTDTFNATVSQQWNRVAAQGRAESAPDGFAAPGADRDRGVRLRRSALENKLASVGAALSIASSPNPIVALSDMITMVTLQRMVLERPAAAELYGEDLAADLVATYREQEDKIWRVGARAMTPEQQQELKDLIAAWRADHPSATYVSNVRLEDFAQHRQQTILPGNTSGGSLLSLVALDPLAGLDPAQRDLQKSRMLAERMFFYASRSPQVLKWQAESLVQSLAGAPEAKQALAAAERASKAAADLADLAEQFPEKLTAEREAAVDHLFVHLGEERQAAFVQANELMTAQRTDLLRDLEQAQGTLQGTLKDYKEAVDITGRTAAALENTIHAADAFVARIDQPADPSTPRDPDYHVLTDFRAAMVQTGEAADRLSTLASNLDQLLASPALSGTSPNLRTAVLEVQAGSKAVIDHAFWRLLILAVATPFAIALAAGLYRRAIRPRA